MGVRLGFYKNKSAGTLRDFLTAHYERFADWYVQRNKRSIQEYQETYGTEELLRFWEQHPTLEGHLEALDKRLLDEMAAEIVTEYDTEFPWVELLEPLQNPKRYFSSREMVYHTKNKEFIQLWDYLTKGRSLHHAQPFESYSQEYVIGFLAAEEHATLKQYILDYFGDRETMQATYWTKAEKRSFQKAMDRSKGKGLFSINIEPKTTGLESVLQVLESLNGEACELITGIG